MDWHAVLTSILPYLWIAVIPWAIQFLHAQVAKINDDRLRSMLDEWVHAAEQIYAPGTGPAKKAFVQSLADDAGISVSDTALEAAVHRATCACAKAAGQ
jgi:hypothetical protein